MHYGTVGPDMDSLVIGSTDTDSIRIFAYL